jgi:DNA-directed RNA polymerase specialized sigma24 family protein
LRSVAEEAWWQQILRRSAIDAYRQRRRWDRDILGPTTDVADTDPWLPDPVAVQAFATVEWHLLFDQVLAAQEACVVHQLYWQAATQRQAAATCALSQTSVRRVHQHALRKLRRAFQ